MNKPTETLPPARRLIQRGRFNEALVYLRGDHPYQQRSPLDESLFADMLQRTGQNDEAKSIAERNLSLVKTLPGVAARYHYVLGSVCRERGDIEGAIVHYGDAGRLVDGNDELSCWVHLRLTMTIADLRGTAALPRLSDLRRRLAQCGDARPFAALHLWIAETETTRGILHNARRHLRIAQSLLLNVDDVWLQGYLAINSFGVCYHAAEIADAKEWASVAIKYSQLSGHQGARRAAAANMGHIQLSVGHLSEAEDCFESALTYCELGSAGYVAVLDSLAQVKLRKGDLLACRALVERIESLSTSPAHSKPNHYRSWALQTKIQLLLREGSLDEAQQICKSVNIILQSAPATRVCTVLRLSTVETQVASRDFSGAMRSLSPLFSLSVDLPPDLFAETEQMIGRTLSLSGDFGAAKVHLQRAVGAFDTIGHAIGKKSADEDLDELGGQGDSSTDPWAARRCLDRVRSLFDLRKRPELFAPEVTNLLQDLSCAELVGQGSRIVTSAAPSSDHASYTAQPSGLVQVFLGNSDKGQFWLDFIPRHEPDSIIASLTFQRFIKQILAIENPPVESEAHDVLWPVVDVASHGSDEAVFESEPMRQILQTISKIAATNLGVLITGETGTGKEVVAKAIHEHSGRASKPFQALNCAALPRELLESQLFGYRRGAFSGATESFQGVIRAANTGTLLLDEIGEMPLEVQPKLLRFLESGEIHGLGEPRSTKVDVRVLFATNTNLEEAIAQKRFREDLFFRMNVFPMRIPPLRERREEIPLLVSLFTHRFSREMSKEAIRFATDTMERLVLYSWPGNVRQLGNEVRRLTAIADGGAVIPVALLAPEILRSFHQEGPFSDSHTVAIRTDQTLRDAVNSLERLMIDSAMRQANGKAASAARILGLSRKGLYLKRERLQILGGSQQVP